MSEVEKLGEGDFSKSVFFFDGPSGAGKSLIATTLVDCLRRSYGWDSYPAAAKNALDDYMGEQIVFMDDVRGGAMNFEDWLKILDPHHASPASARYKNKQPIAPRVVIITSSMSPDRFFSMQGRLAKTVSKKTTTSPSAHPAAGAHPRPVRAGRMVQLRFDGASAPRPAIAMAPIALLVARECP